MDLKKNSESLSLKGGVGFVKIFEIRFIWETRSRRWVCVTQPRPNQYMSSMQQKVSKDFWLLFVCTCPLHIIDPFNFPLFSRNMLQQETLFHTLKIHLGLQRCCKESEKSSQYGPTWPQDHEILLMIVAFYETKYQMTICTSHRPATRGEGKVQLVVKHSVLTHV
jgi:hypothetical protein